MRIKFNDRVEVVDGVLLTVTSTMHEGKARITGCINIRRVINWVVDVDDPIAFERDCGLAMDALRGFTSERGAGMVAP